MSTFVHALITPRPEAEPEEHWYGFVAERVRAGAVPGLTAAEVRSPTEGDEKSVGSMVLVGHEQSAENISDFLSSLTPGHTAAGTLLVAPPSPRGDWHAAGPLRILVSTEAAAHEWVERHGAEVAIRPGGKSFYGNHEISVLINLAALATEIAERL